MANLPFPKRLLALLAALPLSAVAVEVVPLAGPPVVAEARPLAVHVRATQVMLVYVAADGRMFAERGELATLGLMLEPLSRLPRSEVVDCHDCIAFSEFGGLLSENTAASSAELTVNPRFLPPRVYALDPGRRLAAEDFPYRGQPGTVLNYQVLASQAKGAGSSRSSNGYGALLSLSQGLKGDGVLRFGGALLKAGNRLRALLGDSYYEQPLPQWTANLRVGDSRGPADSFFGSSRLLGVHLFTNRALREDRFSNPYYAFSFENRAPGVVEIFRDGALTGRQQIDAGTVTLQDLPASRQGDVRLVVKNVLGEEQVIYAPLFTGNQFLVQGQKEGAVSVGVEHNGSRTGAALAAGQLNYGLSTSTLARGYLEVGENVLRHSAGIDAGSRFGRVSVSASYALEDGLTLALARTDWRYQSRFGGAPLETGVTVLHAVQPQVQTVLSAFATRIGPVWSVTGNAYQAGSQAGGSVGLGRSFAGLSLAAIAGYDGRAGVQAAVRLSFTLGGGKLRSGFSALRNGDDAPTRFTANAGTLGGNWHADALVAHQQADGNGGSSPSYQLLAGAQGASGQADLDLARVGGSSRHSLRGQGALVFDGLRPYTVAAGYDQGGYAVVNTHSPGAEVQLLGQTRNSDAEGRAVFSVPAYFALSPVVRYPGATGALDGDSALPSARLKPGQKLQFDYQGLSGFLLRLALPDLPVLVNGEPAPVFGYYAQLDGLRLGDNEVLVNGVAYPLQVESPQGGLFAINQARQRIEKEE